VVGNTRLRKARTIFDAQHQKNQYKMAKLPNWAMKKRLAEKLSPPSWEQLNSWVALVETGSVSAAAQRLEISQAGVSQHVRRLEESMGTSLLDRSTRPAHPTASGQRLYEQARDLLSRASRMTETVRAISRSKRSLLRVGCVDSFAAVIGPRMVRGLAGRVQRLRLVSGINPGLAEQFDNHQLDVLITTDDPKQAPDRECVALFSEQFLLAVPGGFQVPPLASLQQLSSKKTFMHYGTRSKMGALVDAYLARHDPSIERLFEFDATDPLLSLVREDLGIALTTPMCLWQSRHHAANLKFLPLTSLRNQGRAYPPLMRTFYLVYRPHELGALAQDIVAMVRVAVRDVKRQWTADLKIPAELLTVNEDTSDGVQNHRYKAP
jgi:DNA-binding transcriptional LysR family regulator